LRHFGQALRRGQPLSRKAMHPDYQILVRGNNLRLKDDYLGIANVTLVLTADG
jgi:hypothetical protein